MLTVMLTLSLCGQFVVLAAVLFLSVKRTIRAKSFFDGIIGGTFWLYGLLIGEAFLFSVVIPGLLLLLGANRHIVVDSFPEAICVPPVVLLGWPPSFLFSIIVRYANDLTMLARGKKPQRPPLLYLKRQIEPPATRESKEGPA
jgi:hypothetical protein